MQTISIREQSNDFHIEVNSNRTNMKNSQRPVPKIPDGMVELLKNLAKSVMKEQPENIYLFAAEYFDNLVRERDGSLDKGYSTFRKYDDDILKRRGVDVCPRCNCVLHPEGKSAQDEDPAEEEPTLQSDDAALDMSVSGKAMKAQPRDGGKPLKASKSRRLETIRSFSTDSAIEDDGKSQSTSPKSNENGPDKTSGQLGTMLAVGAIAPAVVGTLMGTKHQEKTNAADPIVETAVDEAPVDPISNDEDVLDASMSDANTGRTVIEVPPLDVESKADKLTALEKNSANDAKSGESEGTTIVIDEEQATPAANEVIDTPKNVDNLQLEQTKQLDRLRTPESDSGLSEKSFNLNVQENEEAVANDVNKSKHDLFIENDKDDAAIVDMDDNLTAESEMKKTETDKPEAVAETNSNSETDVGNVVNVKSEPDASESKNAFENSSENDSPKVEESAALQSKDEPTLQSDGSKAEEVMESSESIKLDEEKPSEMDESSTELVTTQNGTLAPPVEVPAVEATTDLTIPDTKPEQQADNNEKLTAETVATSVDESSKGEEKAPTLPEEQNPNSVTKVDELNNNKPDESTNDGSEPNAFVTEDISSVVDKAAKSDDQIKKEENLLEENKSKEAESSNQQIQNDENASPSTDELPDASRNNSANDSKDKLTKGSSEPKDEFKSTNNIIDDTNDDTNEKKSVEVLFYLRIINVQHNH